MKLLDAFRKQVTAMGPLKRAWFTTFNLGIPFFETHVLPVLLEADAPANRMDYENMQLQLTERAVDLRVFCDLRMMEADQLKRTALPVHGVLPGRMGLEGFDKKSLFHPKVIFLEDERGRMVLGAGSANLSVSGWGRNEEVFSFHTVSSNEQYQQIKRFFEPLLAVAGLGEQHALGVRRRFDGDEADWRFAHSFEHQGFLQALLADTQAKRLTVWSPYYSRDLARLLGRVQDLAGGGLKFTIVPDRVSNRYVRTEWSDAIEQMLHEGVLEFHDRPSPRAAEIAMTHAKLWLASGRLARLAVGSWNCTEPGSASFELRNVEAGILQSLVPGTQIAGRLLDLGADDFGSAEMLEDDELDPPPYPLPFEIQVCFDWEQGRYEVRGSLHEEIYGAGYGLRLPGVKKLVPLHWKERKSAGAWPLEPVELDLTDNEALLADHGYEVWCEGKLEYRGLILETGQTHRRAQGYDSLKDLLNDLVNDVEPGSSGTLRLRPVLRNDDVPSDEPNVPAVVADGGGLSYFRLFHAFEQFRSRLLAAGSMEDLEKILFVQPGSLQELVAKVDEQIVATGNTVFNWFLLQEVRSLHSEAQKKWDRRRKQSEKWNSLRPTSRAVRLPTEISGNVQYMRQLREVCGYGN